MRIMGKGMAIFMKAAIIEDEKTHSDLLAAYVKAWCEAKNTEVKISYYESAESFLFTWDEERDFDILFMDIQMSGMNGMELAKKIRETDDRIVIVFTTGIADYIEEGYEVDAMHYLIKPLKEEKVSKCLDKAMEKRKPQNFILVHGDEETVKIEEETVNYAEAMGHGAVLHFAGGGEMNVKESISDIEKSLDEKEFVKCHRSYICRVGNIHHIDKTMVYFDDGSSIPVSRRMYEGVNKEFIRYFRRQ